ncbi:hypothetical protein PG990_003387 [Apiospora arundinis]
MLITVTPGANTTTAEGAPGVEGNVSNLGTIPGLLATNDNTASDIGISGSSGSRITEQSDWGVSSSGSPHGTSELNTVVPGAGVSTPENGPGTVFDRPASTGALAPGTTSREGILDSLLPPSPTPSSSLTGLVTVPEQTGTSEAVTTQSADQTRTPLTGTTDVSTPGLTGFRSTITSVISTPAGTDFRSTSTTSSSASSSTISTVMLSVEFSAEQASNDTLSRRSLHWKRDDASGFVGDETYQNPGTCSNATLFRQGNGQLVSRQRPLSVDPGVDYINLSDYPGGSISATFSVIGRVLVWNNTAFYGGSARFCQLQSGTVYGLFTENPGPGNCTLINLVVYTANECQNGTLVAPDISSQSPSSPSPTDNGASSVPESGSEPQLTTDGGGTETLNTDGLPGTITTFGSTGAGEFTATFTTSTGSPSAFSSVEDTQGLDNESTRRTNEITTSARISSTTPVNEPSSGPGVTGEGTASVTSVTQILSDTASAAVTVSVSESATASAKLSSGGSAADFTTSNSLQVTGTLTSTETLRGASTGSSSSVSVVTSSGYNSPSGSIATTVTNTASSTTTRTTTGTSDSTTSLSDITSSTAGDGITTASNITLSSSDYSTTSLGVESSTAGNIKPSSDSSMRGSSIEPDTAPTLSTSNLGVSNAPSSTPGPPSDDTRTVPTASDTITSNEASTSQLEEPSNAISDSTTQPTESAATSSGTAYISNSGSPTSLSAQPGETSTLVIESTETNTAPGLTSTTLGVSPTAESDTVALTTSSSGITGTRSDFSTTGGSEAITSTTDEVTSGSSSTTPSDDGASTEIGSVEPSETFTSPISTDSATDSTLSGTDSSSTLVLTSSSTGSVPTSEVTTSETTMNSITSSLESSAVSTTSTTLTDSLAETKTPSTIDVQSDTASSNMENSASATQTPISGSSITSALGISSTSQDDLSSETQSSSISVTPDLSTSTTRTNLSLGSDSTRSGTETNVGSSATTVSSIQSSNTASSVNTNRRTSTGSETIATSTEFGSSSVSTDTNTGGVAGSTTISSSVASLFTSTSQGGSTSTMTATLSSTTSQSLLSSPNTSAAASSTLTTTDSSTGTTPASATATSTSIAVSTSSVSSPSTSGSQYDFIVDSRQPTILYDTILYDTILYDTILYDTILYDTILYDTILYDIFLIIGSSTTFSPSYTTVTTQYSGTSVTTTTVPPSGTAAGTVIVQQPTGYVTTTAQYTGTAKISSATTTTVPPSGTAPGTVIVQTPLPTLDCDPSGYLIQNVSLYRVNITTGASTLIKEPRRRRCAGINAMGYNVGDNFLYGAIGQGASTNLIRIAATGDSTILGSLNVTVTLNAGDVDENNQYWATASGRQWIQRHGEPPVHADRLGVRAGGGNYLWGLAYNSGGLTPNVNTYLQRFDRNAKTWTLFTDFGNIAGKNTWGAVYASDDGFLYGSENTSGEIWKFPLPANGTTAVKISNGPAASSNDGARCIKAANV